LKPDGATRMRSGRYMSHFLQGEGVQDRNRGRPRTGHTHQAKARNTTHISGVSQADSRSRSRRSNVGTSTTPAKIVTGLAEDGSVWQRPAAAVDNRAAATGDTPTPGASDRTIGTRTADRAERDWITRCDRAETTTTATTNTAPATGPESG